MGDITISGDYAYSGCSITFGFNGEEFIGTATVINDGNTLTISGISTSSFSTISYVFKAYMEGTWKKRVVVNSKPDVLNGSWTRDGGYSLTSTSSGSFSVSDGTETISYEYDYSALAERDGYDIRVVQ